MSSAIAAYGRPLGGPHTAAAEAGADSLEEDLHLTKDCVLVARHDPWLSNNTNVAAVSPYSCIVLGKADTLGDMLTADGLAAIKKYADGIGRWKPQVMSWSVSPYPMTVGFKPSLPGDVNTVASTGLVQAAHDAGLFVHVYTFRNQTKYLAAYYDQDPIKEFFDVLP